MHWKFIFDPRLLRRHLSNRTVLVGLFSGILIDLAISAPLSGAGLLGLSGIGRDMNAAGTHLTIIGPGSGSAVQPLPSISLSSTSGPVASKLTVRGSGFPRRRPGRVDFERYLSSMVRIKTNKKGSFEVLTVVPNKEPGVYEVSATVHGVTASATFTIVATPSTPTPQPTAPAAPPPEPGQTGCDGVPAYPEIRPQNRTANLTPGRPTDPTKREAIWNFGPYYDRINGQGCVGTTEQILEWAARKWGLGELGYADLAKAMAVKESWWNVDQLGDWTGSHYCSYSILQIRMLENNCGGWPDMRLSAQSTPFAADYAMAIIRYHYDGYSWLGSGTRGSVHNAVGAYFCGCGHDGDGAYATKVFEYYNNKPWKIAGQAPYYF